jgi:hypothetical protein
MDKHNTFPISKYSFVAKAEEKVEEFDIFVIEGGCVGLEMPNAEDDEELDNKFIQNCKLESNE